MLQLLDRAISFIFKMLFEKYDEDFNMLKVLKAIKNKRCIQGELVFYWKRFYLPSIQLDFRFTAHFIWLDIPLFTIKFRERRSKNAIS